MQVIVYLTGESLVIAYLSGELLIIVYPSGDALVERHQSWRAAGHEAPCMVVFDQARQARPGHVYFADGMWVLRTRMLPTCARGPIKFVL